MRIQTHACSRYSLSCIFDLCNCLIPTCIFLLINYTNARKMHERCEHAPKSEVYLFEICYVSWSNVYIFIAKFNQLPRRLFFNYLVSNDIYYFYYLYLHTSFSLLKSILKKYFTISFSMSFLTFLSAVFRNYLRLHIQNVHDWTCKLRFVCYP